MCITVLWKITCCDYQQYYYYYYQYCYYYYHYLLIVFIPTPYCSSLEDQGSDYLLNTKNKKTL